MQTAHVHPRPSIALRRPAIWRRHRPGVPIPLVLTGLLIAGVMLLPLVYLVVRTAGVGAEVWDLLLRARTAWVILRSVALAGAVTSTAIVIAVPLAWLTVRSDLPGRRFWSVATALPLVIPSYVGGFTFVAALGPRGMLQQALEPLFGLERLPEIYGFPGAWLVLTLSTYPYVLLSVRAALLGMDPAIEEASRSLGKSAWETFRCVTLPHLQPAIAAGGLLVALYTLSDFGAVSLLRFESFTWAIYTQYRGSFDRSMAALLALVLVGLTVLLLLVELRARGRARYYRSARAVRHPAQMSLGRWRWPALLVCALIVGIGLGLPLLVIGFWLVRGLAAGEPLRLTWRAAWHSVYASGLAAVAAGALALPVSTLAVRYPGRFSRLVERTTYIGYGLPGIVIGLSLVFFGANYMPALYQTLAILIFAYVVRFLPQAVGTSSASLLQVSPHVEEVARSLGSGRLRVLRTVTVPLAWPGILAGMALVFLTTMKELPATLLLGPTGFDTLATRIWSATAEAFFARAAAPALLLVAVSALSMFILLSQERSEHP